MKVRPFRIPKSIPWPGLLIRVEEVTRDEPRLPHECCGSDCVTKGTLGAGDDGEWEYGEGKAVIRIYKGLTLPEKRYTLMHELGHAHVDYLHWVLGHHQKDQLIKV